MSFSLWPWLAGASRAANARPKGWPGPGGMCWPPSTGGPVLGLHSCRALSPGAGRARGWPCARRPWAGGRDRCPGAVAQSSVEVRTRGSESDPHTAHNALSRTTGLSPTLQRWVACLEEESSCCELFSERKNSRFVTVGFLPDCRAAIVLCGRIATLMSQGCDGIGRLGFWERVCAGMTSYECFLRAWLSERTGLPSYGRVHHGAVAGRAEVASAFASSYGGTGRSRVGSYRRRSLGPHWRRTGHLGPSLRPTSRTGVVRLRRRWVFRVFSRRGSGAWRRGRTGQGPGRRSRWRCRPVGVGASANNCL